MYDVDGNGSMELVEMKKIFYLIFKIMRFRQKIGQNETPEEMAERIFTDMDCNSDGKGEMKEFIVSCSKNEDLWGLISHFKKNRSEK